MNYNVTTTVQRSNKIAHMSSEKRSNDQMSILRLNRSNTKYCVHHN